MQRFGTYNVRTHEVGIAHLKQDWEKIVRLILSQHSDVNEDEKKRKQLMVKLVFEQGAINEAL